MDQSQNRLRDAQNGLAEVLFQNVPTEIEENEKPQWQYGAVRDSSQPRHERRALPLHQPSPSRALSRTTTLRRMQEWMYISTGFKPQDG